MLSQTVVKKLSADVNARKTKKLGFFLFLNTGSQINLKVNTHIKERDSNGCEENRKLCINNLLNYNNILLYLKCLRLFMYVCVKCKNGR